MLSITASDGGEQKCLAGLWVECRIERVFGQSLGSCLGYQEHFLVLDPFAAALGADEGLDRNHHARFDPALRIGLV